MEKFETEKSSRNNSESKTSYAYKIEYLKEFAKLSDEEFIQKFNNKVGLSYYNIAIQGYLNAIHMELERRKLDYSELGNKSSLSFATKAKLVGKKLLRIPEPPKV